MDPASAPYSYEGRVVVVTGCSSGIGHATAELVATLGADVIGLDVRPRPDAPYRVLPVDLGDPASIDVAVGKIAGAVHGLFNCAGLSGGAAAVLDVVKVNFLGLRHLTEALVPQMPVGAAIANVASLGGLGWESSAGTLAGLISSVDFRAGVDWCSSHPEAFRHPVFKQNGYQVSKKALILYTVGRAYALAGRGVRINSTGPTRTLTPMLEDSRRIHGPEFMDKLPKPLGRDSTARDQALVLAFLNSPAAGFVNGQHIWVDGGEVAGMFAGDIPDPRKGATAGAGHVPGDRSGSRAQARMDE